MTWHQVSLIVAILSFGLALICLAHRPRSAWRILLAVVASILLLGQLDDDLLKVPEWLATSELNSLFLTLAGPLLLVPLKHSMRFPAVAAIVWSAVAILSKTPEIAQISLPLAKLADGVLCFIGGFAFGTCFARVSWTRSRVLAVCGASASICWALGSLPALLYASADTDPILYHLDGVLLDGGCLGTFIASAVFGFIEPRTVNPGNLRKENGHALEVQG